MSVFRLQEGLGRREADKQQQVVAAVLIHVGKAQPARVVVQLSDFVLLSVRAVFDLGHNQRELLIFAGHVRQTVGLPARFQAADRDDERFAACREGARKGQAAVFVA